MRKLGEVLSAFAAAKSVQSWLPARNTCFASSLPNFTQMALISYSPSYSTLTPTSPLMRSNVFYESQTSKSKTFLATFLSEGIQFGLYLDVLCA